MQPRSGAIYSNMRAMSPNNQDISATHLGETSVTTIPTRGHHKTQQWLDEIVKLLERS